MKTLLISTVLSLFLSISLYAQFAGEEKPFSVQFGAGLFNPILSDDGVIYENAEFAPETSVGFSYHASFDYAISQTLAIGIGFNGNYATADFIKNANIDGTQLEGYLEAGAISNSHILVNLTYTRAGEGVQPYARLGLGFFIYQAELGDIPLELTDGIEEERFPDFKYSGFGVLPEIGARYNAFTLSVAYSLPTGELTGETVPGDIISPGSVNSSGVQVNLAYRLGLFGKTNP